MKRSVMKEKEGLSRRKPYVTFHFVVFKIPSFARVISFSFIPNIRKIDNKVREKGGRKIGPPQNIFQLSMDSNPGLLSGC